MEQEGPTHYENFPVVTDVPELLAELGMAKDSTEMVKAVGDLAVITFYYLLQSGKYTAKKQNNETN